MGTPASAKRSGHRSDQVAIVVVTVSQPADRDAVVDFINSYTGKTRYTLSLGNEPTKVMVVFSQPTPIEVADFKNWVGRVEKVAKVESSVDSVSRFSLKPEQTDLLWRSAKLSVRTFLGALVGVTGAQAAGGQAIQLSTFTVNAFVTALIAAGVAGVTLLVKD